MKNILKSINEINENIVNLMKAREAACSIVLDELRKVKKLSFKYQELPEGKEERSSARLDQLENESKPIVFCPGMDVFQVDGFIDGLVYDEEKDDVVVTGVVAPGAGQRPQDFKCSIREVEDTENLLEFILLTSQY